MNNLNASLHYFGCFVVNCSGRNGGLCLLLKQEVDVTIYLFSLFHIDSFMSWNEKSFHLSGIYGSLKIHNCRLT